MIQWLKTTTAGEMLLYLFIAYNIIVLLLYGYDKMASKTGNVKMRIREKTLLWCAALFGGIGACIGVFALRHKSRHRPFLIVVPVACAVQALIAAFLIWQYLQ